MKMNEKNIQDEIKRRIKLLKGVYSRLSYGDKRTLVINNMKKEYEEKNQKVLSESLNITECLDLQNNTIILFDIAQIRKAREAALEQKISLIVDTNLTYEEKRLQVLNELNSSETFEYVENKDDKDDKDIINQKPNVIIYEPSISMSMSNSKQSAHSDSTMESSKLTQEEELNFEASMEIKLKTDFWINNKYYDRSLVKAQKKGMREIKLIKDDNKTNDKTSETNVYSAYLYNNDLNTYNFEISQKLLNTYKMNDIITKEKAIDNEYGLYFCGKKIEKDIYCKPGQMICKNCMEKNKEFYSLNNHKSALININGRVASNKFKDGLYHCLGKYKIDNSIKNCVPGEFCCKACEELNKNKDYYKQK